MDRKAPTSLDLEAITVAHGLANEFGLATACAKEKLNPGALSVGIEIEVPWSSYFPGLWDKYGLAGRRISALSSSELIELTQECTALEHVLLPKLQKTVECGIPRGNDRYWEYAFNPVHDTSLLVEQVRLLTCAGLLPRQRKHSLQVTVGGMPRCRSLYYLAMLLEVQFVDPERIRSGIAQTDTIIHTGWARKGLAGILEKGPEDLKNGCKVASEIRMLQLPAEDEGFSRLMATVQWGVNAMAEHRAGLETSAAQQWRQFEACASNALRRHGFNDSNWSRIEATARRHDVWQKFGTKLSLLRMELSSAFDLDQIPTLEGSSWSRQRPVTAGGPSPRSRTAARKP